MSSILLVGLQSIKYLPVRSWQKNLLSLAHIMGKNPWLEFFKPSSLQIPECRLSHIGKPYTSFSENHLNAVKASSSGIQLKVWLLPFSPDRAPPHPILHKVQVIPPPHFSTISIKWWSRLSITIIIIRERIKRRLNSNMHRNNGKSL